MTKHTCPKCNAPMRADYQEPLHRNMTGYNLLTCTEYACYYTCPEQDLPLFDAEKFAAPFYTFAEFAVMEAGNVE